jgi:hypothetical protein
MASRCFSPRRNFKNAERFSDSFRIKGMKTYLQLLMVVAATSFAADEPSAPVDEFPMTYRNTLTDRNGRKVEIIVEMQQFDWKAHKVEYRPGVNSGKWLPAKSGSNHPFRVDGKEALGTDQSVPKRELKTFKVIWDGKPLKIARSNWRDCYGLFFWSEDQLAKGASSGMWGTTLSSLSESGGTLMITSYGGGGAGSYKVVWIIKRDGSVDRFIERLDG